MFDEKAGSGFATVRGIDNPAFCKQGSDHRRPRCSAGKVGPSGGDARSRTMKYSFINTCFATHHLQFGYDANDTLWLSGTAVAAGSTPGCLTKRDAAKSQGWSPFVLDTNATASATTMSSPAPRSIPARTSASSGLGLTRDAVAGRRLDLVHRGHFRRPRGSCDLTGDRTVGSVQCSRAGIWNPRRRYRQ